nr:hypothetical protein [Flavobacterium sp.]
MKRYLKKSLKIFLWIIGFIVLLFVVLFVVIQIPSVQNYAKDKAVTYLEGKIKTKIKVDSLSIAFPKKVVLTGVYFEDQKKRHSFCWRKTSCGYQSFAVNQQ